MSRAREHFKKLRAEHLAAIEEIDRAEAELFAADEPPSPAAIPLSEFVTEGLLESDDEAWLIRPIIPRGGMGFVAADPKLGKTTLLVQLSLLLAAGRPFFGHFTQPSRTLLLAAEGARKSLAARVHRAAKTLAVPIATPTWYVHGPTVKNFFLDGGQFEDALAEARPHLVILDTLKQFWAGDENSAEEFTRYVTRPLRTFGAKYGSTFILVHHHRKAQPGEEGGPHQGRGSSIMFADADFWWRLTREKGGLDDQRVLHCDKNKYGPEFKPIQLTFDGPNAVLVER